MKQLIICVDGLPYDLFTEENMPFLYNYAQKNSFCRLKTLFSFTGLEYTLLTGKTPDETGIWLEFIRDTDSIFKSKFVKLFSFNKKLRDYAAVLIQLLNKRTWLSGLHNIPNDKIKCFDTSTKQNLWNLDFFKNKTFAFYKWPFFVTDKKRKLILRYEPDKKRLKRLLNKRNKEVYYTQLMSIDKTIHKFGKYSEETKKALKKLDKILRDVITKNQNEEFIIWSDHGFIDIKENIDIKSLLPKLNGYLAFYAGTTAHFWFENENIKKIITKILTQLKCGFILTDVLKKIYKIPLSSKHGELIFVMNPGYYIFPNYYQTKPFKSMHGYPPDKADLDGVLITNKSLNKKQILISDVLKNESL